MADLDSALIVFFVITSNEVARNDKNNFVDSAIIQNPQIITTKSWCFYIFGALFFVMSGVLWQRF